MDAGWLTLGSLLLGSAAWILPAIAMLGNKKQNNKKWIDLSFGSFSACAAAISFQLFYSSHLVEIKDWAALLDTAETMAFVSAVLAGVTIMLNAAVFVLQLNKQSA